MPLTRPQAGIMGNSQLGVGVAFNTAAPFVENQQTISSNYTITTGSNALSAGPVTVASGVVVTIPPGSAWTVV